MIGEIRREHYKLEFFKMPKASHWTDIVFISMGDQAHGTGQKEIRREDSLQWLLARKLRLLAWRTWKLKRKAIGSNDAEVQAILEAEDQNYRTRLTWTEIHGAGHGRKSRQDLVEATEKQALMVKGMGLASDYDLADAMTKKKADSRVGLLKFLQTW